MKAFKDSDRYSYVDLNRSGTPLIEIVSEPDLRTPDEAHAYLTEMKQVLQYLGVSDCDMEKGQLRCDANVSVRLKGAPEFGAKAEVKNLNSFRYVKLALEYEIERQVEIVESGGKVAQESRLYNVDSDKPSAMRSKEHAHDYRYFPEPDLVPFASASTGSMKCNRGCRSCLRRAATVSSRYGLREYDAQVLTAQPRNRRLLRSRRQSLRRWTHHGELGCGRSDGPVKSRR